MRQEAKAIHAAQDPETLEGIDRRLRDFFNTDYLFANNEEQQNSIFLTDQKIYYKCWVFNRLPGFTPDQLEFWVGTCVEHYKDKCGIQTLFEEKEEVFNQALKCFQESYVQPGENVLNGMDDCKSGFEEDMTELWARYEKSVNDELD